MEKKPMGSPRLKWEKKPSRGLLVAGHHKRMVAVSRAQVHLEANN